ncbi:hypothetical protein [Aquabacterium humicola]|uniref:hypothetical protein n=1 Tax=Aquabacterium humicola TaxID=3237377 RepID=UPI0025439E20|nr:hypothetical protein [Rubrivivax pictus]
MNTPSWRRAAIGLAAAFLAATAAVAQPSPWRVPGPPGGQTQWRGHGGGYYNDRGHNYDHNYGHHYGHGYRGPRGGVYFDVGWPYRYGWYVHTLPAVTTAVVIGGLTYYIADGLYYRARPDGYYDVVPPPDQAPAPVPAPARQYTYPRDGQTPAQQASDDYECHRWAAGQTGFDPSASAMGQSTGDAARRSDYARARAACLEGRGYTVR